MGNEWGVSRAEAEQARRDREKREREARLAKERDPKLGPFKGKRGKK